MIFSYTFLSNFENCPRKAYHLYIAKDLPKEPKSPEMLHGIKTHEAFEARLKNETPLPEAYATWEQYCAPLDQFDLRVEANWGLTREGRPTGFFADDVWLRGKADVAIILPTIPAALLLDWKTGKRREDPDELEIFGLLLRAHMPDVERVTGRYVWLKEGKLGKEHDVSDAASKFEQLHGRIGQAEQAIKMGHFPPRENPLCGWCPVMKCEFNKRRT